MARRSKVNELSNSVQLTAAAVTPLAEHAARRPAEAADAAATEAGVGLQKEVVMPITYDVSNEGHVIIATAKGKVTSEEFVEFEVAHATDSRVCPPVTELLIIERGTLERITTDDMRRVLERRAEIEKKPTPHRCGIVIQYDDDHSWNLATFYEGMVMLHSPESVIVFGDEGIARTWLGIK